MPLLLETCILYPGLLYETGSAKILSKVDLKFGFWQLRVHSKVDSIKKWKTPTNLTEVQSFIGLVNYYRELIPNLSVILVPLFEVIRVHNANTHKNSVKGAAKVNPFVWTEECTEAFMFRPKHFSGN
eukprot:gene8482-10423_t